MTFMCRGIRGATTAESNTKENILAATTELLKEVVEGNNVDKNDVAALFFTTSPDLNAEFPAVAARQMGFVLVPLLCGHEMAVPDALGKCIRILILVNTEKRADEINHIYLRDAVNLRKRGFEC